MKSPICFKKRSRYEVKQSHVCCHTRCICWIIGKHHQTDDTKEASLVPSRGSYLLTRDDCERSGNREMDNAIVRYFIRYSTVCTLIRAKGLTCTKSQH